jgi:hypothetical protein
LKLVSNPILLLVAFFLVAIAAKFAWDLDCVGKGWVNLGGRSRVWWNFAEFEGLQLV